MKSLLEHNLEHLDRDLAAALRNAGHSETKLEHCITVSRSGHKVTGLLIEGRRRFFHSTYDPLREAERVAAELRHETAIALGFGTGHHLAALLARAGRVIVVEPEPAVVTRALDEVDLTGVLGDDRLVLIVGDDDDGLARTLPAAYFPAIHGSASVIPLPGRTESEPERFSRFRESLRLTLEAISDDYAVQSRFGRNWMRNTVINIAGILTTGRKLNHPALQDRDVLVTAAGPSLPEQISQVDRRDGRFLIATDTSLPTLTAARIPVDATISIDCQASTYLHFLTAGDSTASRVIDLAVPPALVRDVGEIAPLLSQHPLNSLLVQCGVSLPHYDSAGGNVTDAALSFALACGARSVEVLGADLAYPQADSYARGSYLHAYFAMRASRINPLASELYRFAVERPGAYRAADDPSTIRLPVMDRYRDWLRRLASEAQVPVRVRPALAPAPEGVAQQESRRDRAQRAFGRYIIDGTPSFIPDDVLDRVLEVFRSRDEASRLALLPLVAWLRRANPDLSSAEAIEAAYVDAVDLISVARGMGNE